ncbi:hypothetical protein ACFQ60_38575 [Streptomyces zhihengii]
MATAGAGDRAGDGDARAPDEAAWWAGGEADPGGGDAPAAEEALRGAAVALDATGNGCTVLPAVPGLAEAAEALRRRLPERARDAAVVLGLPDGAPVTPAAADALRSLAGLTDVHLVAAGAGPLADAAAALGPHPASPTTWRTVRPASPPRSPARRGKRRVSSGSCSGGRPSTARR